MFYFFAEKTSSRLSGRLRGRFSEEDEVVVVNGEEEGK